MTYIRCVNTWALIGVVLLSAPYEGNIYVETVPMILNEIDIFYLIVIKETLFHGLDYFGLVYLYPIYHDKGQLIWSQSTVSFNQLRDHTATLSRYLRKKEWNLTFLGFL